MNSIAKVLIMIVYVLGLPILLILSTNLIDNFIEKFRRHKYPEYYERYDAAIAHNFRFAGAFNNAKKRIEFKMKLFWDGYLENECSKESFESKMNSLISSYITIMDVYRAEKEYSEKLWREVDTYAKNNNLKWGIIYDT
jgi:hypothetical protein